MQIDWCQSSERDVIIDQFTASETSNLTNTCTLVYVHVQEKPKELDMAEDIWQY